MKKSGLAFVIMFLALTLIYAGPEALPSGKEMKQVAPGAAAPSCSNWAGFYFGGFGGFKFSSVDLDLSLGGEWNLNLPGKAFTEEQGSRDLDNDGAEAGGLIGYNFQRGCWVFGLEADGGYLWARNSSDTGYFVPPGGRIPLHIRSSFQTHYLFTFAPRVGYSIGRWLPYMTGGLAAGDLDYKQELAFPTGPTSHEGGDDSETNVGWMVGGGLQYTLTDHWSLRAQYQFIDLGDIDFDSDFPGPTVAPAHHRAELREHNASFAIIYKF